MPSESDIRTELHHLEWRRSIGAIGVDEYVTRRAVLLTQSRFNTTNRSDARRRSAMLMRELEHQQRMGEGLATLEREKRLPLRNGSIVFDGNIPARIMAFNSEIVILRVAKKQYTVKREWIEGRFRYGRRGGFDA
jgi:hypothetical protein